jgi:hypothetical protein
VPAKLKGDRLPAEQLLADGGTCAGSGRRKSTLPSPATPTPRRSTTSPTPTTGGCA